MTISTPKNWIGDEGRRNRVHALLYANIITRAYGATFELFVGHHVAFKAKHDNLTTENEIPSADTLLFDHEIMRELFGNQAIPVMQQLAAVPCNAREQLLESMLSTPDVLCPYRIAAHLASLEERSEDWGQIERQVRR